MKLLLLFSALWLVALDTPQLDSLSNQSQSAGITLRWKINPTDDLEAFCIIRERSDGTVQRLWLNRFTPLRSKLVGEDQETYTWTDTNVVRGVRYEYQIQSLSSSGDRRRSAKLSITP